MTVIIGIKLNNREESAIEFQKILTENGCKIKTRIGLNITNGKNCSTSGLILLEILDFTEAKRIEEKLKFLENVTIQKMIF